MSFWNCDKWRLNRNAENDDMYAIFTKTCTNEIFLPTFSLYEFFTLIIFTLPNCINSTRWQDVHEASSLIYHDVTAIMKLFKANLAPLKVYSTMMMQCIFCQRDRELAYCWASIERKSIYEFTKFKLHFIIASIFITL